MIDHIVQLLQKVCTRDKAKANEGPAVYNFVVLGRVRFCFTILPKLMLKTLVH